MDLSVVILILSVLLIVCLILMFIFKSNDTIANVLRILLIILIIIVAILVIVSLVLYFQRVARSEPVLIDGMINARGGLKIDGNKIIKSRIGSEFTYSFWIYPSGWDYKYGKPKHVLSRGSNPNNINENMLFNPGVWFYPETSNLLIRFDTYGNSRSFVKQDNTVLNYIEYTGETPEGEDIYSEANELSNLPVNECKQVCMNNPDCSGISINKSTDTCHIKSSGDVDMQPNNNFVSFIKSQSMNPYQNGPQYFDPVNDCDLIEIPLQRWSHIAISLWNRTTDIYLNGKLVRSCILKNVPRIPYGDPLYVTQDGGFDGNLSNLRYFNRGLNADEIYKLYQYGPSYHKVLTDNEKAK